MGDGGGAIMAFSRMEKVVLITSSLIFSLFFVYLFYRVSQIHFLAKVVKVCQTETRFC